MTNTQDPKNPENFGTTRGRSTKPEDQPTEPLTTMGELKGDSIEETARKVGESKVNAEHPSEPRVEQITHQPTAEEALASLRDYIASTATPDQLVLLAMVEAVQNIYTHNRENTETIA